MTTDYTREELVQRLLRSGKARFGVYPSPVNPDGPAAAAQITADAARIAELEQRVAEAPDAELGRVVAWLRRQDDDAMPWSFADAADALQSGAHRR